MQQCSLGDKSNDVLLLKRFLIEEENAPLDLNEVFCPRTQNALLHFQNDRAIVEQGDYGVFCGAKTLSYIGKVIERKYLSHEDYIKACIYLDLDIVTVSAFIDSTKTGYGFGRGGFPTMLFDRCAFGEHIKNKFGEKEYEKISMNYPDVCSVVPGGNKEHTLELVRFNLAMSIDPQCAMLCTRWGMFELLGADYIYCGYDSVGQFVISMEASEKNQLSALLHKVKENILLYNALRAHNWNEVARLNQLSTLPDKKYSFLLNRLYSQYSIKKAK